MTVFDTNFDGSYVRVSYYIKIIDKETYQFSSSNRITKVFNK